MADVTDYTIVYDPELQLTNEPLLVQVLTVDDDDVYEGVKTLSLTLSQNDSSNNVTNALGLTSETVLIILEDNDSKLRREPFVCVCLKLALNLLRRTSN